MAEQLIQVNVEDELGQNFINYSMAVNGDRAIPDAKTGLKPVARRILYIMDDEGVTSNKPHKKSAKVVGSVMGRVHPHGDSSIYEALVNLTQPWRMRYPLVDWHGNCGNQGGDGPAASRYTECKLAKIAEEGMLANLNKGVVDMQPNYSDDEMEPVTLPALFPNLLCNPNFGIGVAMGCNWVPFNLKEVGALIIERLSGGELDYSMLAPDFPTGGVIINKDDLHNIYEKGKGSVVVRGKYNIENRNKKTLIVFTELPYGVETEKLLEQVNDACEEGKIAGIDEVRDESGKQGLRVVFELGKDTNQDKALKQIFKHTDLQKSIGVNQVALIGQTPKLLNWDECINVYINHNLDCIVKEKTFDLDKAQRRLEIVDGLLKALADIDNIIATIKGSTSASDAVVNLINNYQFTELQAKAIVDMKLGKLAHLEKVELNNEKAELDQLVADITILLGSEEKRKSLLIERLSEFIKKYGDDRRTEVTQVVIEKDEKKETITNVEPEKCVVVLTESGMIKRVAADNYRVQKRNGTGVKTQDDITKEIIRTNTIDNLMIFTNKGKMYRLLVDKIPSGNNTAVGQSIRNLITMAPDEHVETIYSIYRETEMQYVIFVTKNGMLKKTELSEYMKTNRRMGIIALGLRDGDSLANVFLANEEQVLLLTKEGKSIRFDTKDINSVGRTAMGVKAIDLADGDEVVKGMAIRDINDDVAIFSENGLGKKVALSDFSIQNRGGKGMICYKPTLVSGKVIDGALINNNDNLLIVGDTNSICISASSVPMLSRTAVGNAMLKNGKVVSVSKV